MVAHELIGVDKSYRPRLLWSALTSFVKACRSAAYFIRPAD